MMEAMGVEEPRVPNRVRELRENKLMTQAQLARKAKVNLDNQYVEESKRKILLALGLSFEDKDQVFPPMSRSMPYPTSH